MPAARTPAMPVTAMPANTISTIATSGTSMLSSRGGASGLRGIEMTSSSTTGRAPSRSTLPSSAARRSASFIGPMCQPVADTKKTRTTAAIE